MERRKVVSSSHRRVVAWVVLSFAISGAVSAQVDLSVDWAVGGHGSFIAAADYSPSGLEVVSGSPDGSVKRWTVATGALVDTIGLHQAPVTDVAWSPAGTKVASADASGLVSEWDLGGGAGLSMSTGDESIDAIAYSADAQKIYAAGGAGKVYVYSQGLLIDEIATVGSPLRSLAISPDDALLAGGTEDGTLYIWRTSDLEVEHQLTAPTLPVIGLSFSPDSNYVASCEDTRVRVFRVDTGFLSKDYDLTAVNVNAVEFTSNTEVLIATRVGTVKHRNLANGQDLYDIPVAGSVSSLRRSSDGTRFIAGHLGGRFSERQTNDGSVLSGFVEQGGSRYFAAVSADGSKVCSGAGNVLIEVRSTADGSLVSENFEFGTPGGMDVSYRRVEDACFVANGSAWVGACADGDLRFWRTSNGSLLTTISGNGSSATCVGLTSDDAHVIAGAVDGSITSYSTAGGAVDYSITAHSDWTNDLDISPDDQLLVTGGRDGEVRLFDSGDGSLIHDLGRHERGVACVRFSPDGLLIASGGHDGRIRIWDSSTGALVRAVVTGDSVVAALEFSPASDTLAASTAGRLRFFDVATGSDVTGSDVTGVLVSGIAWHGTRISLGRRDGTLVATSVMP